MSKCQSLCGTLPLNPAWRLSFMIPVDTVRDPSCMQLGHTHPCARTIVEFQYAFLCFEMGVWCVIQNCSDQMDHRSVVNIFKVSSLPILVACSIICQYIDCCVDILAQALHEQSSLHRSVAYELLHLS